MANVVMRTSFALRFLLLKISLLIFFLIPSDNVKATHAAGMELFYRWVSDSTYEITAVFFRDCEGFTAGVGSSMLLRVFSPSNGGSFTSGYSSVTLAQLSTTGQNVPPLQLENLYNCISGDYCIEEYVFRGTWKYPYPASDWTFATELCCTPYALRNMTYSGLHAQAGLNNYDFADSAYHFSPVFHNRRPNFPGYTNDVVFNPPTIGVCLNNQVSVSQQVRNYTNDEIRYEFFVPLSYNGVPNTYQTGFSSSNPLPTQSGISIDSISGLVTFIPDSISDSTFSIGVRAIAYNYDTALVGGSPIVTRKKRAFIDRTLYFIYEDSTACRPDTFNFVDTVNSNPISLAEFGCSDNPLLIKFEPRVVCSSIDTNGSHLEIIKASTQANWGISKVLPVVCSPGGYTDGFKVYLDSILAPGLYYLYFKNGDDGNTMTSECGQNLPEYSDTLKIRVINEADGGVLIAARNAHPSDTLVYYCEAKYLGVFLSEDFRCNSLSWDESDIGIYDLSYIPAKSEFISDMSPNCNNSYFADKINITMGGHLDPGLYEMKLQIGRDNNTLLGYCYNKFDTSSIIVRVEETTVNLGPDLEFCDDEEWNARLSVGRDYYTVMWSTGATGKTINVNSPGTYWVEVSDFGTGCNDRDTLKITEVDCWEGIQEESTLKFSMYPNPTHGQLWLEANQPILWIKINSIEGKEVFRTRVTSGKIAEVDLPTSIQGGLYFVKVITSNSESVGRLLLKTK